jgi:hypothetical protein
VFWSCRKLRACESFPDGFSAADQEVSEGTPSLKDFVPGKPLEDYDRPSHEMKVSYWHNVLYRYTSSRLTFMSDRLIALSGIAREVHKIVKTAYFAGMWQDHLPHTLLWRSHGASEGIKSPDYIAPSWSWASVGRPIYFATETRGPESASVYSCVTIIEVHTELANPADPFGQVTAGHIRMCGRLAIMTWTYRQDDRPGHGYPKLVRLSGANLEFSDPAPAPIPEVERNEIILDAWIYMDTPSVDLKRDCAYFLPIQLPDLKSSTKGIVVSMEISGLLLAYQPCGRFKRIGIATVRDVCAAQTVEHLTQCEVMII